MTQIHLSKPALRHLQQQQADYLYNQAHNEQNSLLVYLRALLVANPTIAAPESLSLLNWADTRPKHLRDLDIPRITLPRTPRPPLWGLGAGTDPSDYRKSFMVNTVLFTKLTPDLLALSAHFLIFPYKRGDQLSPAARAAAVIEAIGLKYLTPRHPPAPNPWRPSLAPKAVSRRKYRAHLRARPKISLRDLGW